MSSATAVSAHPGSGATQAQLPAALLTGLDARRGIRVTAAYLGGCLCSVNDRGFAPLVPGRMKNMSLSVHVRGFDGAQDCRGVEAFHGASRAPARRLD